MAYVWYYHRHLQTSTVVHAFGYPSIVAGHKKQCNHGHDVAQTSKHQQLLANKNNYIAFFSNHVSIRDYK